MAGLGGLLGSIGQQLGQARETNPELFQAIGMGLLSGDLAGGFQIADKSRQERLARELQASQFDRRLAQQDSQFDRNYAQEDRQFTANQALQRDQMAQSSAQFGKTFGLQRDQFNLVKGKAAEERQAKNATADWLESAGGNAQEVAMARAGNGADAFKLFQNRTNPQRELQSTYDADGREQRGYFQNGDFVPVGGSKAPSPSGSGLPSGFMVDPNDPKRLTPIPGGPGEQISAELASRLGLADSFIQRAPALRQKLANGDATGPLDRFASNFSGTSQAGVYQELQSGVDALTRMLTGAGQNEAEVRNYARRYLPTDTDTAESAANKLDRLVLELQSAREMAMRGRGGAGSPTASSPGPSQTGGTLPNGLKWSAQ